MGVAGKDEDRRRYVRVRGRELGPSLWGEREEEEAEGHSRPAPPEAWVEAEGRMEAMILTACCLNELLRCVLRLLFLEVDNSERRAAGLDEGAAELVAKSARSAGDDADLFTGGTRGVSGACERT